MARAMHHYMVKSSAGVFRARLVVPMCDWPRILDDNDHDDDDFDDCDDDDDSAGRTRLGAGVLVTELAGPRNINRVLCVTARTASVFVDVLHRLLSGLAGDSESVAARLLVGRADFESATAGNGRGGIGVTVDELQRAASVDISRDFERFHVYPLAGETAIRIVGRPSAVVHCVCLVNELLCKTATAAAASLATAGQRPSWHEGATNWRASASRPKNLGWSVFTPIFDRYLPSSSTATSTYWPAVDPRLATPAWGAHLADQYSPLSPIDTNSEWLADSPRPTTPVWGARLTDQYSPLSPTDTNSDWPAADPRLVTPVWSASERLPDLFSPSGPTKTTTDWPPVSPGPCNNTPIWTVSDCYVNRNQSPRLATAAATRSTIPIWRVSNRLILNRQPSSSSVTTDATATTNRHVTPIRRVSDRLIANRQPSSSRATTNATTTTGWHATSIHTVSDTMIVNQQPSPSHVTTNATTAITSTTSRSSSESRDSSQTMPLPEMDHL